MSVRDVAVAAQFRQGRTISGRGIFLVPLSTGDPDTGEMSPATCYAHACLVAELDVDDETGEVTMVEMNSAYEIGRALNPKLVEQAARRRRLDGLVARFVRNDGAYYPDRKHGPRDFNEYVMPGPGDICPYNIAILERPAPDGPFGGKGTGRNVRQSRAAGRCANAIFNAVGVRIDELPITREKVLGARSRPRAAREAPATGGGGLKRRVRHPPSPAGRAVASAAEGRGRALSRWRASSHRGADAPATSPAGGGSTPGALDMPVRRTSPDRPAGDPWRAP
jgi:hypothetical protein